MKLDNLNAMLKGMRRWLGIRERDQEEWSQFTAQSLQLLDAAIKIDGASKGNVQLFNPLITGLQIVAHRGFATDFLHHFEVVRVDEPSACGRAFRLGRRVIIPDITIDRSYQPYLSIARTSGYRAVQSTPILKSDGSVIGVLSTHFGDTHEWSDASKSALDHYASKIGELTMKLVERVSG